MNEIVFLGAYFLVYAFIGWCLESVYKSVLQKKIINSGFLHGPICPIYGYGAMIMYLSLKDVTNNIFVLFFFGLIVLSVFEYIVGLFLEIVFKTKYWDYSNRKFNIQGRVCLLNSFYWGILGIIFMKGIHPFVAHIVSDIPFEYLRIGVIVSIVVMLVDTVVTTIGLVKINIKLKNWNEITENIKNKVNAINAVNLGKIKNLEMKTHYKLLQNKHIADNKEKLLYELKQKQEQLQTKLERRIARLKKAFPTMNSEALTNFLNNRKKS